MKSLWLYRPLINWVEVYSWADSVGVKKMFPPDQLHATLATVREQVDWDGIEEQLETTTLTIPQGPKAVQILGWDIKALTFSHPSIGSRHQELIKLFPDMEHHLLRAHVSLFRGGKMIRDTYDGELVLGPEKIQEFDPSGGRIKHVNVHEIVKNSG